MKPATNRLTGLLNRSWGAPIHFHLVCLGAFRGQDVFALKVAVHHDDGCGIPVHVSDDGRHGSQLCQFTGVFATVSGDDFISTFFPWTDNRGDEYAIRLDAFCGFPHGIIIPHLKWVIWKRMQFGKWDLDNDFRLYFLFRGRRGLFTMLFLRGFLRHCFPPVGIGFWVQKKDISSFQRKCPDFLGRQTARPNGI